MTEETGVVESPQTEETQIADASTEDLRFLLGTEQPEVGTPEQPETEPVAEGIQGEHPQEVAEVHPEIPEETEEERLAKRRIRPRSALDQQVLDLYKSQAFEGSFADASRVIYGQQAQETQNLQQQPVEDTTPDVAAQYKERVSDIHQEISTLEEQVDEAAENMETAEALRLQREITRKEMEVQSLETHRARAMEKQREQIYNTHRSKAMESRDRAVQAIPELGDKESLVRKQFDEYVRNAQNSPDYASVFESPIWPEIMTREFVMAMQPVEPNQQAPVEAPPQQAPVIGNQAKVLTTGTTTQPANAPVTPEQVVQNMDKLSNDQLYSLLGKDDGRRFLR